MVPNLGGQHADHHLNSRDARRNYASDRRNWLPLLLTGAVRHGAVHARPSVLLFGSIPLHWELRAPGKEATQTNTKFFFQAEDGIRDWSVTGVQTCALPI